jgi:type 1 glutamine amidotransferase
MRAAFQCIWFLIIGTLVSHSVAELRGETTYNHVPCNVLIVTGEDKHHDWRKTTPVLRELLLQDEQFTVDILSDLSKLRDTDLSNYGAVVIHFKNSDPELPGREAFDQLRRYVHNGGGLVLVHFACGAFEEFKHDYAELVGRVWMGLKPSPGRRQHDPRGPFMVHIQDESHAITSGMNDFQTDDELYTCLEGDASMHVIATATSKVDGRSYPLAIIRDHGCGRVFNCTLGHDVRALKTKEVGELYRRGCAWSAGLSPLPTDTPSKIQQ